MEIYYFTFEQSYIAVIAIDYTDAITAFKEKHPDKNEYECLTEEQWYGVKQNYKSPAEVIWTEGSTGHKPEGFNDLYIFVLDAKQIIRIAEGTGDNLFKEDLNEGYVDYIYYEQYELMSGIESTDGGLILLAEPCREKYKCLADSVPDVLDLAYGNQVLRYKIIM